jgi:uncharacterized protein involved in exopolysaccharide biosynthesis
MLSLPPAADYTASNPQLELLPKVLNAIFKYKWLIVLVTLAVTLPVALYLILKTPLYEVKMKVLIKAARSQVALNLVAPGQTVFSPAVTPQIINTEVQILKSNDLLIPAIQQSGYPLLPPGTEDTPIIRERKLMELRARMLFTPVPDANVIEVTIQDPNPKQGGRLLGTLATLYLKRRAALQAGSDATPEFFAKQVDFHKKKYERASNALDKFQEKFNIISLSGEMDQNLTRLMALEATLKDLQAEIDSSTREAAVLETQLKEQPEEITKERNIVINSEVVAMQAKLVEVERQREELLQRYTPQSRFVRDAEQQIASLRAAMGAKEQNVVGQTIYAQNQVKEGVFRALLAKQTALEAAIAKRKTLLEEKKSYEKRLDVLKDASFDLTRLRGDNDLAKDTYFMYEKKSEEARVSQAMDEENIVNASVVQVPTPPVIPLPRNLLIWGPVSAMAGAILGVAIALALDFFNLALDDEREVERFLQVPVLATVRHF